MPRLGDLHLKSRVTFERPRNVILCVKRAKPRVCLSRRHSNVENTATGKTTGSMQIR